jgi:SM-20-related protein
MFYKEEQSFLGDGLCQDLLDYVLSQEVNFQPTLVGSGAGRIDPTVRVSSQLTELGEFRRLFEQKTIARANDWICELGLTHFEPSSVEIEIVAHGDGAFYKRHIDLFTGEERRLQGEPRIITVVYYFHREPKAFTGGQLRLFPKMGLKRADEEETHDIEPSQDKAVVFSSWVAHEVLKVACPSQRFEDSRFAVNCWILAKRN